MELGSKLYKKFIFLILLILTALLAIADIKNNMIVFVANQDKYLHFFTFLFLTLISRFVFKKAYLIPILGLVFLFGIVLEISQELFSNGTRHFHLMDILFNALGILIAFVILFVGSRINKEGKH